MTIFVGTYQLTEEDPPVPVVDASGRFRLYFDGADGGEDVARKAFEANLEKRNITYHSVKPEPIDVDTESCAEIRRFSLNRACSSPTLSASQP